MYGTEISIYFTLTVFWNRVATNQLVATLSLTRTDMINIFISSFENDKTFSVKKNTKFNLTVGYDFKYHRQSAEVSD